MDAKPTLSSPLDAIQEVAMAAIKREDLPLGAREAFQLIVSIARHNIDVRGKDWQESVARS